MYDLQAKAGFGMNIIGILIVTLGINTWGYSYYGLGEFPAWAEASDSMKNACAAVVAGNSSAIANSTVF